LSRRISISASTRPFAVTGSRSRLNSSAPCSDRTAQTHEPARTAA
jgi:hypothetical protein